MNLRLPSLQRIKTGTPTIISFEVPRAYAKELGELFRKSPEKIDVELSVPKRKRTTGYRSQNAKLNGSIQQIANETGNDFADVKLYVKRKAFARGLPFATKANGDIVYSLADGEPMPISEADMDTVQCSWCIEEVCILAQEMGIILREE